MNKNKSQSAVITKSIREEYEGKFIVVLIEYRNKFIKNKNMSTVLNIVS